MARNIVSLGYKLDTREAEASARRLASGVDRIGKTANLSAVSVEKTTRAISRAGSAARLSSTHFSTAGAAVRLLGVQTKGVGEVMGSLVGLGLNPLSVAFLGVGAAVGFFLKKQAEAKKAMEELEESSRKLSKRLLDAQLAAAGVTGPRLEFFHLQMERVELQSALDKQLETVKAINLRFVQGDRTLEGSLKKEKEKLRVLKAQLVALDTIIQLQAEASRRPAPPAPARAVAPPGTVSPTAFETPFRATRPEFQLLNEEFEIWIEQGIAEFKLKQQHQKDLLNEQFKDIESVKDKWRGVFDTLHDSLRQLVVAGEFSFGRLADALLAISFEAASRPLFERLLGAVAGAGGVDSFQSGGIVPGFLGEPQLARVHGGELITPAGRVGRSGATSGPNIGVNFQVSAIDAVSFDRYVNSPGGRASITRAVTDAVRRSRSLQRGLR